MPKPADDDGYRLWLRYDRIADAGLLAEARAAFSTVVMPAPSAVLAAARDELSAGLRGFLDTPIHSIDQLQTETKGALIAGTLSSAPELARLGCDQVLSSLGSEGFSIRVAQRGAGRVVVLIGKDDRGVLYGGFHLLRHLQIGRPLAAIEVTAAPRAALRMLDHWDNLDGSIERGYAGASLWNWQELPGRLSPRIRDYARANASVGINAVVLNNVNADARILTAPYLAKVAALADAFRPWGIRVLLSARFSAPIELDGLPTADPQDERVAAWWRAKTDEIVWHIPDFGGFLVKANSEGQPGPQDYGRTHAEGANMLADALAPHHGLVIWRAFVYRAQPNQDRAKQAFAEFAPLDGAFRPNVLLQVKNGPIDFQPREPLHPLFGAMPHTPMVLELQITQEYLGFATHLAFLAPLFAEVLNADTHAKGPGSTVARVVDGSLFGHTTAGLAGVANVGNVRNWCGHPFAQANWYAFGRLAWNGTISARDVAEEWLRMTFSHDQRVVGPVLDMMLTSREAVVDYMTPLGLHHLMAKDHHFGPGPWVDDGRPDWTSVYYHRADQAGIGFDRTASGSDAVALYARPLREQLADPRTCPENLLLWFHHLGWDHVMLSGRSLWDEICRHYTAGVAAVQAMRRTWDAVADLTDKFRFEQVRALLEIQEREARWWRNACLLYFQTFARRPLPDGLPPLEGALQEYRARGPASR
jgi:alpha-glucuronidase